MIQTLLVSYGRDFFSHLESIFAEDDVGVTWAESGSKALSMVSDQPFDLIIADETLRDLTGLDLAKKVISINPMLNLAIVSALSPHDFHEASEGLGILMQLPPAPEKLDAEKLLKHLKTILILTRKTI